MEKNFILLLHGEFLSVITEVRTSACYHLWATTDEEVLAVYQSVEYGNKQPLMRLKKKKKKKMVIVEEVEGEEIEEKKSTTATTAITITTTAPIN